VGRHRCSSSTPSTHLGDVPTTTIAQLPPPPPALPEQRAEHAEHKASQQRQRDPPARADAAQVLCLVVVACRLLVVWQAGVFW
jgi:hypothetical protein